MKIIIYLVGWFVVAYTLFYLIGFIAVPIVIGLQIIQSIWKAHKERELAKQSMEQVRHEELLQAIKDSKHKE